MAVSIYTMTFVGGFDGRRCQCLVLLVPYELCFGYAMLFVLLSDGLEQINLLDLEACRTAVFTDLSFLYGQYW